MLDNKKGVTEEALLKAIEHCRGNITGISKSFGVSRQTIYNYINQDEVFKKAVNSARESTLDLIEKSLEGAAIDGNITAGIFILKTRAKQRGYVERQEISGPDGGTIPISIVKMDVDDL